MDQRQNTYIPPQTPVQPPTRRRVRTNVLVSNAIFPDWLSKYAIITYFTALVVVNLMYNTYSLPWYYMSTGVVAIIVFFLFGYKAVKDTSRIDILSDTRFERQLFISALIMRAVSTIVICWAFQEYYGDTFGFENGDALGYDELGRLLSRKITDGNFAFYDILSVYTGSDDISDMGYAVYVGVVYWLTDNSINVLRALKCILSAWTVVMLFRLARRNFGSQVARVAAVFCMLWPNFWYYCSAHLKEVEMVFLVVLFLEQADQMLRSRKFTAWKILPIMLIVAILFTFRTVLAIVCIMSLIFAIAMSSTRVVSWGKRIVVGLFAILVISLTIGNRIQEQSRQLLESAQGGYQAVNMEWRAERKDASGNQQKFAKYAGAAVFAPMIFTIPFPTMVKPFEGQNKQQMLNGGNCAKTLISFFTIIAIISLFLTGKWRENLLFLSFVIGYLVVLTFSAFAQSERFHQPVMPFEFMFAAYGLNIVVKRVRYKRWFGYWCVLMLIAVVAWNWFKLAGRGLI